MQKHDTRPDRRRRSKLVLVDRATGQVFDADIRRGGRSISAIYGPNWFAMPSVAAERMRRDTELQMTDIRVLLFMLARMEVANHIRLRTIDVANQSGLARQNASTSLRKLVDRGYLVKAEPFGWRLHPSYAWRGNPAGEVVKRRDGSLDLMETK